MKKACYVLVLFFTVFLHGQEKDVYSKIFGKNEGVNFDEINTLCFDNDGFLWLGGSNLSNRTIIANKKPLTLQRFDGIVFHDVLLPKIEKPILSVEHIYKRKDGLFYLVTKTASSYRLYSFDAVKIEFQSIRVNNIYDTEGLSDVYHYNGEDYIISQEGKKVSLNTISKDLEVKSLFSFSPKTNTFNVQSSTTLIPFKDFCIISARYFEMTYFDWNGNILKTQTTIDYPKYSKSTRLWVDEYFKRNNTYYTFVNDNNYLFKIDTLAKEIVGESNNNKLKQTHLKTFTDNSKNLVLFSYDDGTLKMSTFFNKKLSTKYQFNIQALDGLTVISKNLDEDVFLATNGKLHYFKFPKKNVKTYLKGKSIRTIKQKDLDNIIVATETDGWHNLNIETDSVYKLKYYNDDKEFNAQSSRNILELKDKYWSSTSNGLFEIDKKSNTVNNYRYFPTICMESLNDSIIIYGTNKFKLLEFNTNTKEFKSVAETDSLYIFDLVIKNNIIFCATDKGVLKYDYDNKKSKFFDKSILSDPFLLMVDYNKNYGALFGSRSGEIYSYNEETDNFKSVYKDEFNAGIATILFDKDDWWINTFNGFVKYNTKDKSIRRFSDKDGFSHNEANRYSALKTDNGFFVGTLDGLNFFKPENLELKKDNAQLTLLKINKFDSGLKTFNDNFNREYFNNIKEIVLPAENRALQVDFGLRNNFAQNNGATYKYRLNNKNWINLNQNSSIRFPNLAAGIYQLEIRAVNFSGLDIGQPLILQINSKDFFYKSWLFIVGLSLIIITILLYFLRQFQIRKKLQDQFALDLINSQENERKRIARELHDSVSQQLTLIKRKAQNEDQTEISELTNNTLEEVRHISRGLFPPLLKQLGLTESIKQLILDIDENNAIFVSSDIEKIDNSLGEEQSLHLYRFIQETINNILKHADAKAFSIEITKHKNEILILIKDNGKGFNFTEAKLQNSLGLKTLEERIKILNGEFSINSKIGKGTTTKARIFI
ncbi:histidine kinase [Winogradskyella litorisediminis]|uniref:histidine kinase n=1 Tax=Winogradskyella litorisediminis TaxID=1156618 RepID=A0ABW3N5T0_9FLAO